MARAIFWRSGVLLGALGGGLMSSALILTILGGRLRAGGREAEAVEVKVLSFLPLNCCVSVKVNVAPGWFV